MARTFMAVKPPTISYNAVAMADPISFSITRVVRTSYVGGRPKDAFDTTVERFRDGYTFSATFGDASSANTLAELTAANSSDKSLVGVAVGSHAEANLTYTLALATITSFPALGQGFQEGRTFSFSGVARSSDGSTDPLTIA